jgi:chromosome segregation ATPase
MSKANQLPARACRAQVRLLAFAFLAVGGGCGEAEELARRQAEELKAVTARLDKLEAELARMAEVRIPFEKEIAAETERKAAAEEIARQQAEALAAITAKLDKLETEWARMEGERAALEMEIEAAKGDETKQKELEAKLKALDEQMAANEGALIDAEQTTGGKRKTKSTGPKKKQGLSEDYDPLGGI